MKFFIYDDKMAVGENAAKYIASRINEFAPTADRLFVLGLPTGIHQSHRF